MNVLSLVCSMRILGLIAQGISKRCSKDAFVNSTAKIDLELHEINLFTIGFRCYFEKTTAIEKNNLLFHES